MGNDGVWLTGTPDFASGVNQQRRSTCENARFFGAQVDRLCEKLSTTLKS